MTATGAHQANSTHSVHALVRLLKSPTDPPSSPGPSKIDIARSVWSDPSFRAANKGEVIGDWVYTQLGHAEKARKDKDANPASHPIGNPEYWTLLRDVLTTSPSAAARPIKAWLLPLLGHTPLNHIVTELLALHASQVHAPARAVFAVLWPLAEKKMGADALAECLSVALGVCAEWENTDDDLAWICSAVIGSYKNALGNAGNKKKLYTSFLTTHLPNWLRAVSSPESSHMIPHTSYTLPKSLQDILYAAGTDTLFSLDALKQPLDTLFDALSSSPFSPLPVLSKLFASLLSAMHKYRSALFPAAASALIGREEVRKRGMEAMGRCWALVWGSASVDKEGEVEVWKFVVGLFDIVERERLFVANSFLGANVGVGVTKGEDGEGERALVDAREKVIGILEAVDGSVGDDRAAVVTLSIQVLDALVRIEYDLVGGVLGRVLTTLINIPPTLSYLTKDSASALLIHLLEYHTKTRTVHTYALALLGAAASCSHSYTASSIPSSPLLTNTFSIASHLPCLARALRAFLTPTQTTTLGPAVLKETEDAWAAYILLRDKDGSNDGERDVKRRKLAGDQDSMDMDAGGLDGGRTEMVLAQAFSHTGRMAGTILSNLPVTAYAKDGELDFGSLWSDVGKLGWTVVWRCLREESATGVEQDKAKEKDRKKKKRKRADEIPSSSSLDSTRNHIDDTVASAALRFLYDVRARVSSPLGDCDQLEGANLETLMRVARDEGTKPELVLEIIRTLLWHTCHTHTQEPRRWTQVQSILTTTFTVLTAHFSPDSHWSGVSASLTRNNLGIALLYLLMDRWIDVIDALASTENLEKLASVLLSIPLDVINDTAQDNHGGSRVQQDRAIITPRSILLDVLRNAQFWELHNIRAVFLSSISILTAPLSSYTLPTAASASSSMEMPSPTDFARASDVYILLLHVPPEYFTRPVRAELVKRAIGGNVGICAMLKDATEKQNKGKSKKNDRNRSKMRRESYVEDVDDMVHDADVLAEEDWTRRLAFLRVFLQRMGHSMNAPDSAAFIEHLLSSPPGLSPPSDIVKNVTLDLIKLHFMCALGSFLFVHTLTMPSVPSALLRSHDPEAAPSISSVIATIIAARPFSQPDSQETWTHILVQSSVLRLIECLREDFILASLPDEVVRRLGMLHDALVSSLLPHVNFFLERDLIAEEGFPSSRQINAWSHVLSFTQWLGIKAEPAAAHFGLKLASAMLRGGASDGLGVDVCSNVFALLFEELRCAHDLSHSAHLDLVVAFYSVNGGDRGSESTHVAATSKLSVDDFSHLLDTVAEGIGGSGLQACQRERLIHLSMVLLHDAPRGTLKVIQNFATRCLNLFSGQVDMYGDSSRLKAQYLEFIAKHCSDRPTAIRSVDLGSIWSLLNKILSRSFEHDKATSFPIFYHVVTIIGALLRLRRDLVVHTLPHLSLVLRQLMMTTRSIRPQLGAKQSKIVTDTFPSWISSSQPLAADEGRALARLLTTLTTKTIPRTYTHPPIESQKAESLAKPFAKHAGYVLIAYIDALNDPLCVMTTEMRRELEPGLFALCEMVGEHSRDAVMMSALDSGGKAIMKALWKEYEKQRYVGRG
ncbi:hypothetical protein PAXRUDRAFT_135830 [Paxillus rubicundulus Ve08.2h10]|uniref:Nucleolar 27S pre-rRNA processing Urb2/Npa2 C-terminal domain-containing protein n=1 Tax=Paxillus rubicundulus Ve08.2h10 TaxID=930991 RepID=A0A0D0E1G6_9AGAM|nr:hypothetical protein PAXRUDRAFT_135830 [Paxillus rubicundulus Ve08.2h10]